ncbi:TATA box-binding protein-associated factor RNA polymerase I subunit B [Primulina tabacum]|uniref:TATA box-binding protein-associated factor RNA polymerase I subunit B n=1 Tax=Primulina tabacum TaxID=48773 RepID=UPI003F5AC5D2
MTGRLRQTCQVCGSSVGFMISDDGFFYCGYCNSQAEDIFDTGVDEEQIINHYSASHSRVRPAHVLAAEPISQVKCTPSQFWDHHPYVMEDDMDNEFDPTEPVNIGSCQNNFSYDDYHSTIRSRYLTGLQVMIQLQCEALVEKFNASPLIVGLAGPIWLRFLASTRIMADEWADQVIHDSEGQTQGEAEEFQPSAKYRGDPVNILGKRVVMIWYRSLRSIIPISCSLAISFLVCHVAREAILPSDILKWTLEGKLPYFSAFCEIEKQIGSHSKACPISVSRMFRPIQVVSSQKLESMAADIALKIGLELPSVNFHAIASRYCSQLSLPSGEILSLACRIYEWSMPTELYLSVNELRIPTRVCVMSVLIVAIRILFDINGYGMWESRLSNPSTASQDEINKEIESQSDYNMMDNAAEKSSPNNSKSHFTKFRIPDSGSNGIELLQILESKYSELDDAYAYCHDLSSYLQYCKDVVFSGLRPSFEDLEEEKLLEEFWDLYQNDKGPEGLGTQDDPLQHDKSSGHANRPLTDSHRDARIRQLKLDMEEHKFCYVPPRVKVKRKDYVHYVRKRKEVYIYAVHADYYILLRSCAKVAQVETRIMHQATLNFERRLKWLEKMIVYSVNLKQNLDDYCDFCRDDQEQNHDDDTMEQNI